jgi:hypothetical protein
VFLIPEAGVWSASGENTERLASGTFPDEIFGNNGWNAGLVDDTSPARHLLGYATLSFVYTEHQVIAGAKSQEGNPAEVNNSQQDYERALVGIEFGNRLSSEDARHRGSDGGSVSREFRAGSDSAGCISTGAWASTRLVLSLRELLTMTIPTRIFQAACCVAAVAGCGIGPGLVDEFGAVYDGSAVLVYSCAKTPIYLISMSVERGGEVIANITGPADDGVRVPASPTDVINLIESGNYANQADLDGFELNGSDVMRLVSSAGYLGFRVGEGGTWSGRVGDLC